MKNKKILALIIPAMMMAGGVIGCGSEAKESGKEQSVSNIVYLEDQIKNSENISLIALKDGEQLELGEYTKGYRYYNSEKDEHIVLQESENGEHNVISINNKGERTSITSVTMAGGLMQYSQNGFLYYVDSQEHLIQLNLESKEKVSLGKQFEGTAGAGIYGEYYIYIENNTKLVALKEKTNEKIEISSTNGVIQISNDIVGTTSLDKEIIYFNTKTGEIKKDKIDTEKEINLIDINDDTAVYYEAKGDVAQAQLEVKKKKIGKDAQTTKSLTGKLSRDNGVITFDVVEGEKEITKAFKTKGDKLEILTLGENVKGKASTAYEDIYYGNDRGVYKAGSNGGELIFESLGGEFDIFEQGGKIVYIETLNRVQNPLQSRETTYRVYIDGKVIEEDVEWISESGDEFIFRDKDGVFKTLIDGEVKVISIDSKYEGVSNKDDFSPSFGEKDLGFDYYNGFNINSIDGFWKSENEGITSYYLIQEEVIREIKVTDDKYELDNFVLYDNELENTDENKFKAVMTNIISEEGKEVIIERLSASEIKIGEKVLKRSSKTESDEVIKSYMDKGLKEDFANRLFSEGEAVVSDAIDLNGKTYYMITSLGEDDHGSNTYYLREDGEVFKDFEFAVDKKVINDREGSLFNFVIN